MAKINIPIPKQNWEFILQRIAIILLDEILNQKAIYYDENLFPSKIYLERSQPFNHDELNAINVQFAGGTWDNKHAGFKRGNYLYHIDCICKSKNNSQSRADELSSLKAHQLAGICNYILEDPQYCMLDYKAGIIASTIVEDITTGAPKSDVDSENVTVARLTFRVVAHEDNKLLEAVALSESETTAYLVETEEGYKYLAPYQ